MTRRPDPSPPPVPRYRVIRDLRQVYVRRWVVVDAAERIIPACGGDCFLTEWEARRHADNLAQLEGTR